jgi:hypothetical protein
MELAAVTAVIAGILILYLWFRLQEWLARHWLLVRLWRHLSGEAHHGRPITDAGWLRPGQKALTTTGHAHRWWYRTRWQRASYRTGSLAGAIALTWAYIAFPLVTSLAVAVLTIAGLSFAVWRLLTYMRTRRDRKTWQYPAHQALHALAGWPESKRAIDWISVVTETPQIRGQEDPKDKPGPVVVSATLALPQGWPADAKQKQQLISRAAAKLAIESPDTSGSRWAGPAPLLVLCRSEPPPGLIGWDDVAEAVAKAHSNELVAGLGKKRVVVKVSWSSDSAHLGINMGSGGGKSNLSAFWLVQELMRGSVVMILDAKWFSHPWAYKDDAGEFAYLPNVAYCSTPHEIHAGLMWLKKELDRRKGVARAAVTASGRMRGNIGPRLIVLAEELNLAIPDLKAYWRDDLGGDGPSPALAALRSLAFAGRALKMHVIFVGQMLTAEVTGGGKDSAVKQNIGLWAMNRYGPNGWKTAAGDVPMPPPPDVPGRIQLVQARKVTEVQTPLMEDAPIRELAVSGVVELCPPEMPGAVAGNQPLALEGGSDLLVVTGSAPVVTAPAALRPMTLKEIAAAGILHPKTTHDALRMARHRDPAFPVHVDERGQAWLYEPFAVRAWDMDRRS